jgi:hypothetical protein
MRFILAVTAIFASTTVALSEESYLATGNAFGACVGEQMRFAYNPPGMVRDVIKLKCGKLEELERDQFADFIRNQIDHTFTAETAATMMVHLIASPQKLREDAIDAYPRKQTSVSYAADCDVIVCNGGATVCDKHLASKIHCVDEIIGWLQRREQ